MVENFALKDNHYNKVCFYDDFNVNEEIKGNTNDLISDFNNKLFDELIIGIGYNHLKASEEKYTFLKNKVNIYPNPTKGTITIASVENTTIDKIEIVDFLGKIVSVKTENTSQIDISEFSNGVYILKIHSGESTFEKKIIKQ